MQVASSLRTAEESSCRDRYRFPALAVWRASGPANPAVDLALGALGDAFR
jgi:hypothetical protein